MTLCISVGWYLFRLLTTNYESFYYFYYVLFAVYIYIQLHVHVACHSITCLSALSAARGVFLNIIVIQLGGL